MKKYFFFALIAGIALCNVACGSDDDNESTDTTELGNTVEGDLEDKAAHYDIEETEAPKAAETVVVVTESGEEKEVNPGLTGFDVTEYGQAVIEVDVDGSKKYCSYETTLIYTTENEDKYELKENGVSAGTVRVIRKGTAARATRASEGVELIFDLVIKVEIYGEMVELKFDDNTQAQEIIEKAIDDLTSRLTNTWNVERMKLVIDFDEKGKTDASTEVDGGDLRPFIQLAKDNDVNITEKDERDLSRTIAGIIIGNPNLFVLKYADGRSDAADWSWKNKDNGNLAIGITLKDQDMGNKFFNDDSKVTVELRANNKINLILQTHLDDDKCNVYLIVNLK